MKGTKLGRGPCPAFLNTTLTWKSGKLINRRGKPLLEMKLTFRKMVRGKVCGSMKEEPAWKQSHHRILRNKFTWNHHPTHQHEVSYKDLTCHQGLLCGWFPFLLKSVCAHMCVYGYTLRGQCRVVDPLAPGVADSYELPDTLGT